jgi:hypothetical protein
MQSIKITLKDVYGETKAYPACPKACVFADMLGTNTLTQHALRSIQRLGYEVEVVALGVTVGKIAA